MSRTNSNIINYERIQELIIEVNKSYVETEITSKDNGVKHITRTIPKTAEVIAKTQEIKSLSEEPKAQIIGSNQNLVKRACENPLCEANTDIIEIITASLDLGNDPSWVKAIFMIVAGDACSTPMHKDPQKEEFQYTRLFVNLFNNIDFADLDESSKTDLLDKVFKKGRNLLSGFGIYLSAMHIMNDKNGFVKRIEDKVKDSIKLETDMGSPLVAKQKSQKGTTRTGYAALQGSVDSLKILKNHDIYVDKLLVTYKGYNEEQLINVIKYFIAKKDDKKLKALLNNNKNLIESSTNHCAILNLAVDSKLTATFGILIEAGFDPDKSDNQVINPLALACKNQGKSTLELYIEAIRDKYGDNKVRSLLNKRDLSGMNSLDYAITGRSYLRTINLIIDYFDFRDQSKTLDILCKALQHGHLATFELLLDKIDSTNINITDLVNGINYLKDISVKILAANIILSYLNSKNVDITSETRTTLANLKRLSSPRWSQNSIHKVCQVSSEKVLVLYIKKRTESDQSYQLSDEINSYDKDKKTPLYYAISDNAYNAVVELLLIEGANPFNIGLNKEGKEIDAFSLALRKQEFSTLGLLLKDKLQDISKQQLNLIIKEAFEDKNQNNVLYQEIFSAIGHRVNDLESDIRFKAINFSIFTANDILLGSIVQNINLPYQQGQAGEEEKIADIFDNIITSGTNRENIPKLRNIYDILTKKGFCANEDQIKELQELSIIPKNICTTIFDCISKVLTPSSYRPLPNS